MVVLLFRVTVKVRVRVGLWFRDRSISPILIMIQHRYLSPQNINDIVADGGGVVNY